MQADSHAAPPAPRCGAAPRSRGIRRASTRRRRHRRGTELLELALVAFPILLLMVFGTIEFGTYFYVEHNLQSAAREGARAGVVANPDERDAKVLAAIDRVFEESSLSQMEGFSYDAPIIEVEDEYLNVTVRTTWSRVPEGLRPMLLIRNAEKAELKGFAAMRIENNTLAP